MIRREFANPMMDKRARARYVDRRDRYIVPRDGLYRSRPAALYSRRLSARAWSKDEENKQPAMVRLPELAAPDDASSEQINNAPPRLQPL